MTVKASLTEVGNGITAIDTDYVRPMLDASHLIVEGDRAAFVDTGTSRSVPLLLAALEDKGIGRDQVDYVLCTHVHLDHAGGAGELMDALPKAKCVFHPRGAPHMIDPTKLEAGTRAVYGDEAFEQMYGRIVPIDEKRVIVVDDNDWLELDGRPLEFIHTPGHALHHYCIVDRQSKGVFTGDNFGISYRELDTDKGPFLFPTTTPTQFDPDAMHQSVDRIMGYTPQRVYLTHYSVVEHLDRLSVELHSEIDAHVDIAWQLKNHDNRTEAMKQSLYEHYDRRLTDHGYAGDQQERHRMIDMDIKLNVQGLETWLERMKKQGKRL